MVWFDFKGIHLKMKIKLDENDYENTRKYIRIVIVFILGKIPSKLYF